MALGARYLRAARLGSTRTLHVSGRAIAYDRSFGSRILLATAKIKVLERFSDLRPHDDKPVIACRFRLNKRAERVEMCTFSMEA